MKFLKKKDLPGRREGGNGESETFFKKTKLVTAVRKEVEFIKKIMPLIVQCIYCKLTALFKYQSVFINQN